MRVTFVLPGRARRYSGGFKVLYSHAALLARRGHSVNLVHAPFLAPGGSAGARFRARAAFMAGSAGLLPWSPEAWMPRESGISHSWVPRISEETLPDADALIVSFWHTAEWVRPVGERKGRKLYLIQEYEMYMTAGADQRRRMEAGFKGGFRNVAISPAVAEMLRRCGASAAGMVPNGIDLATFRLANPIDAPSRLSVGFPWRPEGFKGAETAVSALEVVRERLGRPIEVWSFGPDSGRSLPEWIRHVVLPPDGDLARLYNGTAVFVLPSDYEGWGLPGCEAMACGAALVATDSGGVKAYATSGETALLSPAGDVERLAAGVLELLNDEGERIRLAARGHAHVQQFTWERAADALEAILERG